MVTVRNPLSPFRPSTKLLVYTRGLRKGLSRFRDPTGGPEILGEEKGGRVGSPLFFKEPCVVGFGENLEV